MTLLGIIILALVLVIALLWVICKADKINYGLDKPQPDDWRAKYDKD